jgi:hypothetical protein
MFGCAGILLGKYNQERLLNDFIVDMTGFSTITFFTSHELEGVKVDDSVRIEIGSQYRNLIRFVAGVRD